MRNLAIAAALLALPVCQSFAENVLISWGDGVWGTDFIWYPDQRTILIVHGNGLNYKFWVHDGSGVPGTISIADIDVHDDATGDLTLLIQHPDGYVGALDWEQGDLRYAGGTSTVTGVKVAGQLGEPGKEVILDRVDGSIEVAGSVEDLDIYEWLSASPASIQVAGDAHWVTLRGSCAGDILVDGYLTLLRLFGHLSGSLDVGGASTVYIDGDILDSGQNYVWIRALYTQFECQNMELSGGPDRWLTIGPQVGGTWGHITIHGTLSGVVWFAGAPYAGKMIVGTIDAGPEPDPEMQYGGLYFTGGTEPECSITVWDSFKQGWIFANATGPTEGEITVWGDLGQESPATVARILTGTAETDGGVPIDFGWSVFVCGDVWPSVDGAPVIYSPGDLAGYLQVGAIQCPEGQVMPGVVIQIDESLVVGSAIQLANAPMPGEVLVGGDVYGGIGLAGLASSGYVRVDGDLGWLLQVVSGGLLGTVEIVGDVLGRIHIDLCDIDGGRIHVYGSLTDTATIRARDMFNDGAIAIDYDGWHEFDHWDGVISIGGIPYYENTPELNLWEIQPCKGDMNNNGVVDAEDPNWLAVAISDPNAYEAEFPGLEGSLWWHGDLDCDGDRDQVDQGALAFFAGDPNKPCCQSDPECAQYEVCRADLNRSGRVDLPDLAGLLAAYGSQQGDPNYNPDADFDANGSVGLYDLNFLLAVYGYPCDCFAGQPEGFAPEGDAFGAPPPIQVWFQAIDTGGYSGGGFNGEVDHFVFDLKVDVNDPNNDWTATGAVLPARNSATFRLSSSPTTPDAYATFVSAPWTTIPSGPGATQVIGAYEPPDPTYQFETSGINIAWFDTVDSENGPAAVMRLVIDVSDVEGADTSGGFGSVYFSKTGPTNPEDILVADVESETGHCFGGCNMHALNGSFYVQGE